MDEIINFLNQFSDRFPKNWLKVDDYVNEFLPKDNKDPFNFESKYKKKHICNFTSNGFNFIPKDKASKELIEGTSRLFDLNLIDYDEVFTNFDREYFNIDEWCSNRLEYELKLVREFLFDCSVFKGIYLINNLLKELSEIEHSLNNIWDSVEPNWIQTEIVHELKVNLGYIKSEIIENFSTKDINTNYSKLSNNSKEQTKVENKIWYKLAELLADETILITNQGYYFKGKLSRSERQVSKDISQYLNNEISDGSIRPYLSGTKANIITDKNIFYETKNETRIPSLKLIAAKAESENKLSNYFKEKLEELIFESGT